MTDVVAVDTSVAVPLLVSTHTAHGDVTAWWQGRDLALAGHAALETYSVLTRLPGDLRVAPADAARLLRERFAPPLMLSATRHAGAVEALARLGVAGGATYDGIVALAAAEHGAALATRDGRARSTYEAVGVAVLVVSR